MIDIITAANNDEYKAAAVLFKEYAVWLNIDLSFQNFNEELIQIKEMYNLPNGGILLAKKGNEYIGCVAIRKKENQIAELKRMYVKPSFQQQGIGVLLLQHALKMATNIGYKKIWLDTLDNMHPAIKLYEQAGFYKIPAYYYNPEPNAIFFEKLL
jgi:putative acetyltransferase